MVETIKNDAYTWSCVCPNCGNYISRGEYEKIVYCNKCGIQLHQSAFTEEAITEARLQKQLDDYED